MRDAGQIQTDEIVPLIHDAAGDVGAIQQELSPLYPIFNILQGIPKVGDYLGQVEPLLAYADGLAQAGNEIAVGFEPLLEGTPTGKKPLSILERASQVVQSGQDHFVIAAQEINQANQAHSRIKPELLPDSVRPMYMKLDENFNLLVAGVHVLRVSPQLLGVGEHKSYLVLAQNRDELRYRGVHFWHRITHHTRW